MAYTPVAQRKDEQQITTGYIPVAQRTTQTQSKAPSALSSTPLSTGLTKTSTPQTLSGNYVSPADLGIAAAQGIARGWAATGAKIAETVGTASTDVIDPKTIFGTGAVAERVGTAIFGTTEPFNATSEDVEFLSVFGVDPDVAAQTGGSLTILLTALDLTGAGEAGKGLLGAIKAVKAADTTGEALRVAKSLGLSDDIAQEYADIFLKARTTQEAKQALEAAAKLQNETRRAPSPGTASSKPSTDASTSISNAPTERGGVSVRRTDTSAPFEGRVRFEKLIDDIDNQKATFDDLVSEVKRQNPEIDPAAIELKISPVRELFKVDETADDIIAAIDNSLNDLKSTIDDIPTELRPLAEEARKYKSADEFVETIRNRHLKTGEVNRAIVDDGELLPRGAALFHGTAEEISGQLGRQNALFTTDNPTVASKYIGSGVKNASGRLFVIQPTEDLKIKNLFVEGEFGSGGVTSAELRKKYGKKYDGVQINDFVRFEKGGRAEYDGIHHPSIILFDSGLEKTKVSQLTDFYNQATGGTPKGDRPFPTTKLDKKSAKAALKAVVERKQLQKWENLQEVLGFPKAISKMTPEQIEELARVLDTYKTGDEFLPVRMMETLPRTKLAEAKTIREVLELLAKETGLTPEKVAKLKPTEFHRYMGDHMLSRQHPFYEHIVLMKNEAFLKANARVIELSNRADELVKKARASRKRGVGQRLIPTDNKIIDWLEADNAGRETIKLTNAEREAATFMDNAYRSYYEYLVKRNAERKFSRFENQYFPHIRRGFLEAWKEDGLLKAFKEMRDQYAQDQKYLDILNERTGEILPYEKWIGFQQFRSDNLVPSKNASAAFEAYVTTLEKARHLDELVPEMMAYVHALSPRNMTKRGLELDTSLKRFVKEWVNANKGRTPKGFFEPGGQMDWLLRSSVAFTRIIDLGFNFTTQIAAPIGEHTMTLTMLKPNAYAKAVKRRVTPQGRAILKKYENFTGRTFFGDLSRGASSAGDRLLGGMFAIYHTAAKSGNNLFLLGKMTDEEFKAGTISSRRLAELQVEMNKYRVVKGAESIMGRTAEATAFKQYKSWAIPILRATYTNARDLAKMVRAGDARAVLSSEQGKELFYSIGIGVIVAGTTYGYYNELADKKNRNFVEDATYKAMRDAMSMMGALDPTLWSSIRVADFFDDIAVASLDIVTLDTYKDGRLKGPRELGRAVTPAPIRQLQRQLQSEPERTPTRTQPKTPAGLPELPAARRTLPTPPGLPSLP